MRFFYRKNTHLINISFVYRNRQRFLPQSPAFTAGACPLAHKLLKPVLHPFGGRFKISSFEILEHPPVSGTVFEFSCTLLVHIGKIDYVVGSVKNNFKDLFRQILNGGIQTESVMAGKGLKTGTMPCRIGIMGFKSTLVKRKGAIWNNQIRIKFKGHSKSGTFIAGAVGIIKGEQPRLQFGYRNSAVSAGTVLAEKGFPGILLIGYSHDQLSRSDFQCSFDRFRQSLAGITG